MATINGLPVYKIKIDESSNSDQGINFVSLVDYPAIESNWVALSESKNFTFSEEKQLLLGAIMIPGMPIYRSSPSMGEYYVVFTEQEIEKLVRKFQATQKTLNLNYQHQADSQIQQAVIQEIWLTGTSDKSKDYGFDLPKGSAFVVAHFANTEFWNNEIKTGKVKGFSIEGFLDLELKSHKMEKFVKATSKEGVVIESEAEAFASGIDVYVMEGDAKNPVADGTYTFDNGMVLVIEASKVKEITEPEAQLTEEEVSALKKVMAPLLKEYEDKLAAFEVQLKNITPAKSEFEKTDKDEVVKPLDRMALAKQAIEKLNKFKNKQ